MVLLVLRSQQRRPSRGIWLVVPLTAIWGNLHGAVLVGVAVIGCYLLFSRLRTRAGRRGRRRARDPRGPVGHPRAPRDRARTTSASCPTRPRPGAPTSGRRRASAARSTSCSSSPPSSSSAPRCVDGCRSGSMSPWPGWRSAPRPPRGTASGSCCSSPPWQRGVPPAPPPPAAAAPPATAPSRRLAVAAVALACVLCGGIIASRSDVLGRDEVVAATLAGETVGSDGPRRGAPRRDARGPRGARVGEQPDRRLLAGRPGRPPRLPRRRGPPLRARRSPRPTSSWSCPGRPPPRWPPRPASRRRGRSAATR